MGLYLFRRCRRSGQQPWLWSLIFSLGLVLWSRVLSRQRRSLLCIPAPARRPVLAAGPAPGLYPGVWRLCCRLRLGTAKYLSFRIGLDDGHLYLGLAGNRH